MNLFINRLNKVYTFDYNLQGKKIRMVYLISMLLEYILVVVCLLERTIKPRKVGWIQRLKFLKNICIIIHS